MQAAAAVKEIVEKASEATPEERDTAARVTALMRHLFLYDRGNQLRVMEETGLSLTQCKAILAASSKSWPRSSAPRPRR